MGGCTVRLPVLFLKVATVAHVIAEQLGQVLGLTICDGPLVVGWLPLGGSLLLAFCRLLGGCVLVLTLDLGNFFLLLLLDWLLDHLGGNVES